MGGHHLHRQRPPDGLLPHRDALVIQLDINNTIVHRVLVDIGSSINVMHYDVFTKLGFSKSQLTQVKTPLSGFTANSVGIEGSVVLLVEVGMHLNV